MVEKYGNVLLRKVNIGDGRTIAAKQAAREFGMKSIPYVRVYDGRGNLLGEVRDGNIRAIEAAVRKEVK